MLPTEYPRHRPKPSTLYPCRVSSSRLLAPLFRGDEAATGKALVPAYLLLVVQESQEGPPELEQHPGLLPLLEPAPTGARTPISPRAFTPLGPGPEYPEDAFKAAPVIHPRASTPGGRLGCGKMDANRFPLLLGQFSPCHGLPSRFARQHMALSYSTCWVLK